MFNDLRRRIINITMAISTIVIVLSFTMIFGIVSVATSEKREAPEELRGSSSVQEIFEEQIRQERNMHRAKLGAALIGVGVSLEVLIFIVIYFAADKIVQPVQRAYEGQQEFVANAAHELKTPVAALQANFEALDVNEEPWSSNIELELDKANGLVRDLLALAKIDGRSQKVEKKRVDLSELVKKYANSIMPRLGEKELKLDIEDEIAETLVKDDYAQIMNILLDNAVKYSKSWVKVSLHRNVLEVSNDGKKISDEKIGHIFERFYQADKTANGSGLGLAIAKATADKNKWQIIVSSNAKQTSFRLELSQK